MQVSVAAGTSAGFADGPGAQAQFRNPHGVAVDGDGNIIVADNGNHRIRKIGPDAIVSTVAGTGSAGFADGPGAQAQFMNPLSVSVDGDGNIIVADKGNHRIRKVAAGLVPPAALSQLPPQVPSVYTAQMEALLDDEILADVTFAVGDARIHAHRAILVGRSDYFRAMLTSGFRERREEEGGSDLGKRQREDAVKAREIPILDTTPEAFKALLRYLYTDELEFADEHLIDVMRKAKEISLERVYAYAVRRTRRQISMHNVVDWFVKADKYGLEDLRSATLRFLTRNLRQVKAQARQSLQVLSDKPNLLMEVMLEAI